MIGICAITHGKFAAGIKNSAEMIMGEIPNFAVLGLFEGEVIEEFQSKAFDLVQQIDNGDGVLVFVDMFGATPFNTIAAIRDSLMEHKIKCGIVTGLNLPMLVEAISMRETTTLQALLDSIVEGGKESIKSLDISLSV